MKAGAITIALAGVMAGAPFVSAQSLGELARQEDARRSTARKSARTFTNADLKPDSVPAAASQGDVEGAPAAGAGYMSISEGRLLTADEVIARSQARIRKHGDERYWRQSANTLRMQLETAQAEVDLLSSPVDRSARQQALADKALAKAEKKLADLQARWQELEELARYADVPRNWIDPQ